MKQIKSRDIKSRDIKSRNINTVLQDRGEINLQTRTPKSTHEKLKNRNGKLAQLFLKRQMSEF